MLVASQLKSLALTGKFGITVFSEGILDCIDLESQRALGCKFKDGSHIDTIDFSKSRFEDSLRDLMAATFKEFDVTTPSGNGLETSCRSIGYFPRAADPVVGDLLLAANYGERAGSLITSEGRGYKVITPDSVEDLSDLLDQEGEVQQCWVDTTTPEFVSQRKKQYRINPGDLSGHNLEKITKVTNLTAQQMKAFLIPVLQIFQRLSN